MIAICFGIFALGQGQPLTEPQLQSYADSAKQILTESRRNSSQLLVANEITKQDVSWSESHKSFYVHFYLTHGAVSFIDKYRKVVGFASGLDQGKGFATSENPNVDPRHWTNSQFLNKATRLLDLCGYGKEFIIGQRLEFNHFGGPKEEQYPNFDGPNQLQVQFIQTDHGLAYESKYGPWLHFSVRNGALTELSQPMELKDPPTPPVDRMAEKAPVEATYIITDYLLSRHGFISFEILDGPRLCAFEPKRSRPWNMIFDTNFSPAQLDLIASRGSILTYEFLIRASRRLATGNKLRDYFEVYVDAKTGDVRSCYQFSDGTGGFGGSESSDMNVQFPTSKVILRVGSKSAKCAKLVLTPFETSVISEGKPFQIIGGNRILVFRFHQVEQCVSTTDKSGMRVFGLNKDALKQIEKLMK